MPYDQGDIVLVTFPLTDLTSAKVRPAIVVSNDDINSTNDVILAAITTNIRNDEFSFELQNTHLSTPMVKPSEVRCHKLFICDQDIIQKVISTLNPDQMSQLAKSLKRCFSTV